MIVYYAHPTTIYNTPQEERDIETLHQLGFMVLNPNAERHAEAYKKEGFKYFLKLVSACGALVFRSFPDGPISSGVYREIAEALRLGIPVFELPSLINSRALSADETYERLKTMGYY